MFRKIRTLLLAAALAAGTFALSVALVGTVSASAALLPNFTANTGYPEFTDVKDGQWYTQNVRTACSYGLMNGIGEGLFDPAGTVTVAQVVTIAARLSSTYYADGAQFPADEVWYRPYAEYAIARGWVPADTRFELPCSRAAFAAILSSAVEKSEFAAVNSVDALPDVSWSDWFGDSVFLLYRAGVLSGNDAFGTFSPYSNITRAETAAILSRIVDSSQRKTFTLAVPGASVNGTALYGQAFTVLELVNKERAAAGLAPLQMDTHLLDTAMLRAAELTLNFSHYRPNGWDCYSAFPAGSWSYGENIGKGQDTAATVMHDWMASAGHRASILNPDFHTIGIGCVKAGNAVYWVQCFGTYLYAEAMYESYRDGAQVWNIQT